MSQPCSVCVFIHASYIGLALLAKWQQKAPPLSRKAQQADRKTASQRVGQPLVAGSVEGVRSPGVADRQP